MKHLGNAAAAKHPLMHAYELIFDVSPMGDQFMVNREALARRFLAKALETHPDRATGSDRTRAELTAAFRELEAAFKLLSELLGGGDNVLVGGVEFDVSEELVEKMPETPLTRPRPARGWQARPTPEVLERDVSDLATMKDRAIHRRMARRVNEARAKVAYDKAEPAEKKEVEKKDPRPTSIQPTVDKRFMLGRYLLRRGHITLRQLVDAVLWQRAQRPRVGELAIEWGIMTKAEVYFVLREKTVDEMFCDVAVRLGFLTPFQRLAILARQRRMQMPIGQYFIDRGILQTEQVDKAANEARALAREAATRTADARP